MSTETQAAVLGAVYDLSTVLGAEGVFTHPRAIAEMIHVVVQTAVRHELDQRSTLEDLLEENGLPQPIKPPKLELLPGESVAHAIERLAWERNGPFEDLSPIVVVPELTDNDCHLIISFMNVHGWQWAGLTPENVRQWAHIFNMLPALRGELNVGDKVS